MVKHLPKRTDNEIKNYWNAHLKKRLANMGIDPVTHKPVGSGTTPGASSSGNSNIVVDNDESMTPNESATAQESEPTPPQPTSSRSTSTSALLLNKLATRVTILQCVDPLRACLQPMSFNTTGNGGANSTESADIICHPTSTAPDTVLSPESAEYGNTRDDVGISDTNIEYPISDPLSNILENVASEPTRSNFLSTSARVLNNMAPKFASFRCIDELHNWQNNNIPAGPIQCDQNDTTTTGDGGLSAGNVNIDDMVFDSVGSPVFYNSNYLDDCEVEPSDLFDIP
ncbi:hypothetical protein REPUB_Repub07fG0056100 [Reevesia pubescens]